MYSIQTVLETSPWPKHGLYLKSVAEYCLLQKSRTSEMCNVLIEWAPTQCAKQNHRSTCTCTQCVALDNEHLLSTCTLKKENSEKENNTVFAMKIYMYMYLCATQITTIQKILITTILMFSTYGGETYHMVKLYPYMYMWIMHYIPWWK